MSLDCKNCGKTPPHPTSVWRWTEYWVGGLNSDDRFYLCSDCEGSVDPRDLIYVVKVPRVAE